MASMVGLDEFDEFLFKYVQHFKAQLVSSEVSHLTDLSTLESLARDIV